jgi:hypothetical protein
MYAFARGGHGGFQRCYGAGHEREATSVGWALYAEQTITATPGKTIVIGEQPSRGSHVPVPPAPSASQAAGPKRGRGVRTLRPHLSGDRSICEPGPIFRLAIYLDAGGTPRIILRRSLRHSGRRGRSFGLLPCPLDGGDSIIEVRVPKTLSDRVEALNCRVHCHRSRIRLIVTL